MKKEVRIFLEKASVYTFFLAVIFGLSLMLYLDDAKAKAEARQIFQWQSAGGALNEFEIKFEANDRFAIVEDAESAIYACLSEHRGITLTNVEMQIKVKLKPD